MDIESLLKTIEEVSQKLYPDTPEVAKLCLAVMVWERLHVSVAIPHYKEPFARLLKGVEDRLQKRLAQEKQGGEK
jgi:hypothetical protein